MKKCYYDEELEIKVHVYPNTDGVCECGELVCEKEPIMSAWGRVSRVYNLESDKFARK